MEIKELLERVRKPSRYLGGEYGSIVKKDAEVKIALAYPDLYEIGMSYIGLKILYFLINSFPYASAERVFMPRPDMIEELIKRDISLFSLETKTPIGKFDIFSFSLLYELNYTNVLWMLKLSKIPLLRREREEDNPIVGAGGPNVSNPEPLTDFVDFFYLGDGEPFFSETIPIFREIKGREERLEALRQVEGVYIPDEGKRKLHHHGHYYIEGVRVKKRIAPDLDEFPFPEEAVLSHAESVFDRLSWEIARGCPQKCRFCQATQFYSPFRARNISKIANSLVRSLKNTGYEEVSFSSLSTADFPGFHNLLLKLYPEFKKWSISVSLPSLRPKILRRDDVASIIAALRKTSFTIVPEAGTERLRAVINKDVSENGIMKASETAFSLGWRRLKLYFMIGLPTEREEDIRGIAELLFRVSDLGRKILGSAPHLSVSVSNFVPMPWTPFQWLGFENRERLRKKQSFLLNLIKRRKNIRISFHKKEQSFLEAFLSRADFRAGEVIRKVFEKGGALEAWTDNFDFSLWEEAFSEIGLEPKIFTDPFPLNAPLPWEHMELGPRKNYLKEELEKAFREERTPSCLELLCGRCKGCDFWKIAVKKFPTKVKLEERLSVREEKGRFLYLLTYKKMGNATFLTQTDLLKTMERIFRRTGSPLSFTQGFHPKPRISLPPALPVGVEGEKEMAEVEFTDKIFSEELSKWNKESIKGLEFLHLERIEEKIIPQLRWALYSFPCEEKEKISSLGFELIEKEDGCYFIHDLKTPSPAKRAGKMGLKILLKRSALFKEKPSLTKA